MIRFPPIEDAALDAEQRRMADMAQHGGPFQAFLRAPSLWQALQSVRLYLSRQSSLDGYTREALMLLIARHWTSPAGYAAHVALAQKAGLTDADIDALGRGCAPVGSGAVAGCAIEFASGLLTDHRVGDAQFADASGILGERTLVDIIGLIGFFSTICLTLNVMDAKGPAPFGPRDGDYSPADETPAAGSGAEPAM
ncbi:MAG: hypothetical protein ABW048_09250 [Sphingobium sp.]